MAKPKAVDHAPNFRDWTGELFSSRELEDDLNEIIDHLGCGNLLPARYYRRGIDRTEDELLRQHGIKHLHLGGADSDILLFLVEYDERVVLLEINSHKHFESEPPGSVLRSLHDNFLRDADREARASRVERVDKRGRTVREGLLPRKDRD